VIVTLYGVVALGFTSEVPANLGVLGAVRAPTQHQQVADESDETGETGHALILIDAKRANQTRTRNPRSTHRTSIRHPQVVGREAHPGRANPKAAGDSRATPTNDLPDATSIRPHEPMDRYKSAVQTQSERELRRPLLRRSN
jgi:hypothetical protein